MTMLTTNQSAPKVGTSFWRHNRRSFQRKGRSGRCGKLVLILRVSFSNVTNGPEGVPNLSIRSRELAELQDMYRRALAASWAAQPGELQADECIEDIFVGGDGMGNVERNIDMSKRKGSNSRSLASDQHNTRKHRNESSLSFFQGTSRSIGMDRPEDHTALYRSQNNVEKNGKQLVMDELEYRDNLCSWVISRNS